MSEVVIDRDRFEALVPLLSSLGYTVVAPTLHEGTIVYATVRDASDLPIGWTDEQAPGSYRVQRRDDDAYFGYTVGPRSLRAILSPPNQTLLTITHAETGLEFRSHEMDETAYAVIGVRACELAALAIEDRVLVGSTFPDPRYAAARSRLFTVAVNCGVASATCFCTSMGTGPEVTDGYDLVLTEVIEDGRHEFVAAAGTPAGGEVLEQLGGRAATSADRETVAGIVAATAGAIDRRMPDVDVRTLLVENLEHPMWEDIARRCLTCTNCTLVCPTCFCSTVTDATDLDGTARRVRSWDSCFDLEFTNLHGHPVRSSPASRYRQWMTHKLAYWFDQFGSSGCVGCGRCITWCPVGIDITEEVRKLAEDRREVTA